MSNLPVKLVKIPSDYAGTLTANGIRLMDFKIPADLGFVDLDKAYLLLKMNADTGSGQTVASRPNAIRAVGFGAGADRPKYDPDVLIRNAYMDAANVGRLEDHNDCNLINQTLHFHERSAEDLQSNTIYDGTFETDEYGRVRSNFRDLRFLEVSGDSFTNYSLTSGVDGRKPVLTPEIKIPLKSVCKMADGLSQFPIGEVGDMHLHCELEDTTHELLNVFSGVTTSNLKGLDASGVTNASFILAEHYHDAKAVPYWGGQPVSVVSGYDVCGHIAAVYPWTEPLDFTATAGTYTVSGADLAGGSGTGAEFTITVTDKSPYDTNQVTVAIDNSGANYVATDTIVVSGTHWGSDASLYMSLQTGGSVVGATTSGEIIGMEHNYNGVLGQVRITLSNAVPAGTAGQVLNGGLLTSIPSNGTADWSVIEANLVVPQLMMNQAELNNYRQMLAKGIDIDYMVYDVEAANVDGGSRFNRQFTLPPMCGNFIAVTPRNDYLLPYRDLASSYRVKVNETYTTESAIAEKSQLYYDRIIQTYDNLGKDLKNLDCEYRLDTQVAYDASGEPFVMMQPVPLMPEQSQLDLEIHGSLTQGTIYGYKQRKRTLRLNNNGAELMN